MTARDHKSCVCVFTRVIAGYWIIYITRTHIQRAVVNLSSIKTRIGTAIAYIWCACGASNAYTYVEYNTGTAANLQRRAASGARTEQKEVVRAIRVEDESLVSRERPISAWFDGTPT